MALGIPVICVVNKTSSPGRARGAEFQPEYVKHGAAYPVSDPAELGEVLDHLRKFPGGSDRLAGRRESYASRFLARAVEVDGVNRTAQAIEEQLSGRYPLIPPEN